MPTSAARRRDRPRSILAEIFVAPDCAAEPEAYDAWRLARDILDEMTPARRIDLAASLDALGLGEG
jgi:hypothetical protein